MKNKQNILYAILLCTFISACAVVNKPAIHGDGNIVDKKIDIEDYNGISIENNFDVVYEQDTSQTSSLKIQIDENLLEYLDIRIENGTLIVAADRSVNVKPSTCRITTNSQQLKKISIAGSGKIEAIQPLQAEKLNISVAGSGDVILENLSCDALTSSIAGSGNIVLSGNSIKAKHSIAGSGNIYASQLVVDSTQCSIAGSGDISVYTTKHLRNSIAGSGNINYKGDPTVKNSIAGSGSIQKIE